jgi:hypothetical protein
MRVSVLIGLWLLRSAEHVFAMETLQVVQNTGVNDFTELGSGNTDGGRADEAANQGTCNAAKGRANRPGDNANGHTDTATGQGTAHAGKTACNGTNRTSGFATEIAGGDLC